MAIVRESAAQASGSDTAPTFTKPATLNNGDVLVVGFGLRGNTTVTVVPTGWVLINSAVGGTLARAFVYRKIITNAAGEPATYVWTVSATEQWAGGIVRYSGVDTTTPEDVASATAGATGTAAAVGGITTVTANAMIGVFIAIDATTSTTITLTAGDAPAQVWETTAQICNEYDDGIKAAAGDTTSIQWTLSGSRQWGAIEFALRPATGGQSVGVTPAVITVSAVAPAVVAGAVSRPLTPSALTLAAVAPAVAAGAVSRALAPVTVALTAVAPAAGAAVSVALAPGVVTLAAVTPATAAGSASVALTPGLVTLAAVTPATSAGGSSLTLTPASVTLAAVAPAVTTTGAQSLALPPAVLSILAVAPAISGDVQRRRGGVVG